MIAEVVMLDDVEEWIEELTSAIEDGWFKPSAWESDFLDSVREKLEAHLDAFDDVPDDHPLTEGQVEKLREIWKKVTE